MNHYFQTILIIMKHSLVPSPNRCVSVCLKLTQSVFFARKLHGVLHPNWQKFEKCTCWSKQGRKEGGKQGLLSQYANYIRSLLLLIWSPLMPMPQRKTLLQSRRTKSWKMKVPSKNAKFSSSTIFSHFQIFEQQCIICNFAF